MTAGIMSHFRFSHQLLQKVEAWVSRGDIYIFFSSPWYRRRVSVPQVIKLPLEMATTPTKALPIMCSWAAKYLIIRP